MAGYDAALVAQVRAALAAAGDPERAAGQQRYLRSAMPFHGISSPERHRILAPVLRARPAADRATWEATVLELWDGATHREERYAALALAQDRSARAWQDPDVLGLYRHLVVTGAWWDLVDETATRLVGPVLLGHRAEATPVMDEWAVADDLWLRRTAILSQLKHKDATGRCWSGWSWPISRARPSARSSSCARRSGGGCASWPGPTRPG